MIYTQESLQNLSYKVIGAAIEVHRELGPGLLESVYEKCLLKELEICGINCVSQVKIPISYKGLLIESDLKLDILIENILILELKAIECVLPVHEAQLMTYMNLLKVPKGLLINFNSTNLSKEGIKSIVNQHYRLLT